VAARLGEVNASSSGDVFAIPRFGGVAGIAPAIAEELAMGDLIQLIVSGIATGAIYALAALGFTLLWQAAGVINFAQGEFVMLPAFAMLFGVIFGAPLWLAFLIACALAALVLGLGFKRIIVDPL